MKQFVCMHYQIALNILKNMFFLKSKCLVKINKVLVFQFLQRWDDSQCDTVLTHCGLVMSYGNINMGWYWLR